MQALRPFAVVLLFASLAISPAISRGGEVSFREVVLDPAAAKKTCYAVVAADVDGDGKRDVVVITENRVQWYRNPDWTKQVILENQTELDLVSIAPHDIDGDGKIDFAIGAGWTKIGTIQWISRSEEADGLWNVYPIAVEPWTHRMRWSNVLGKKSPQLVVSPLNKTQGTGVRLLAYEVPKNPRSGRWRETVLDDTLNRMHNHWHIDFDGDGVDATLTASEEGLTLISKNDAGEFVKRKVGSGMPAEKPADQGAGEIKVGRLAGGRPFMATIEPMHGTSVVVYTAPPKLPEGELADRLVLDDTLGQGHAVGTADLDGDGSDEIIIGHREPGPGPVKGPGVYIYSPQDVDGKTWKKQVLDDGGMACEDLICEDFNGDGRVDIVAVGRKTLNVKLYLNLGAVK